MPATVLKNPPSPFISKKRSQVPYKERVSGLPHKEHIKPYFIKNSNEE